MQNPTADRRIDTAATAKRTKTANRIYLQSSARLERKTLNILYVTKIFFQQIIKCSFQKETTGGWNNDLLGVPRFPEERIKFDCC